MSNYATILSNFDQQIQSPDFNFIATALNAKQEKYDKNKAQLQTLYDQIKALQVKNGVDQEYIEQRLQQVKGIANKYSYVDLSDQTFANAMLDNVGQVLDDKVVEAVLSSKRFDADLKMAEDLHKKHPDKYSDKNKEYAIAHSDMLNYLNADVAGTRYMGGFVMHELGKPGEKINEIILKQRKALAEQNTRMVPGTNYGGFGTYQTITEIPREELEMIIANELDDKDRMQLRIDAWAQFDKLPEEQLMQNYENRRASQISQIEEAIQAVDAGIAETTDENKIASGQKTLQYLADRKAQLEERNYNMVRQSRSKEDVYAEMYTNDFIQGYVNEFSYGPRVLKEEINQAQKAAIEFSELQRWHNIQAAQDRAKLDFDKEKFEKEQKFKYTELGLKYPGQLEQQNKPGGLLLDYFEDKTEINDREDLKVSAAERDMQEQNKAINGLKTIGISPSNAKEIRAQLKNLTADIADGKTIIVGGKQVNLADPANAKALLEYKTKVLETPKSRQVLIEATSENIKTTSKTLADMLAQGDLTYNDLTNFNFKIKDGKEVIISNGRAVFNDLLQKKKRGDVLTKDQEMTLQLYSATTLAKNSLNLNETEQTMIGRAVRNDLAKLGFDFSSAKYAPLTFTKMKKLDVTQTNEHGVGDLKWLTFTDMTIDLPTKAKVRLEETYKMAQKPVEETYLFATSKQSTVSSKTDPVLFERLREELRLPEGYKGVITYRPLNPKSDGTYEKLNVAYYKENTDNNSGKKGEMREISVPVDKNKFQQVTGLQLGEYQRTNFDVRLGNYAETINLGKSAGLEKTRNLGAALESYQTILNFAKADKKEKLIEDYRKKFESGALEFKLEPIPGNGYYYSVYENGKRLNQNPLTPMAGSPTRLTTDDYTSTIMDANTRKTEAFLLFLETQVK
jgi:hypothetical protein